MTTEHFIHISGLLASATIAMGYLPQTIRTIKTRSTDDIAGASFLLMALGALFFIINGLLTKNYYLVAANVLTCGMSAIVYGIKIANDVKRRKDLKNKQQNHSSE